MTLLQSISAEDDRFATWWRSYLRGEIELDAPRAPTIRVVDLFSGSGGFGLGAMLAARSFGRRAVFGAISDVDSSATKIYGRSLPVREVLNGSVAMMVDHSVYSDADGSTFDYEPEILDPKLEAQIGRTDLMIAGPPCQGHSNLNNHTRRDDPRNDLFISTAAIGVALRVPIMVIENVPSVVDAHGEVVSIAKSLLRKTGYAVAEGILCFDRLGGWQTRRRYFMIAVLNADERRLQSELDSWRSSAGHVPSWNRPALSALWAMEDLADRTNETLFDSAPDPTATNKARIDHLFDNDLYDLPNHMRPECHRDGTSYGAVYGRMRDHLPAPTITTGFGTPGQGRFIHPTRNRLVTPHEAARLQGFPDSYGFRDAPDPTRKALAKWIGDAVPPMLGAVAVGVALGSALDEEFRPAWCDDS